MYALNHLDKKEITEWENKTVAIKVDFNKDKMKLYFYLKKDCKVYAQNSGGTTSKHNFASANQAAKDDAGDELRQYISRISWSLIYSICAFFSWQCGDN